MMGKTNVPYTLFCFSLSIFHYQTVLGRIKAYRIVLLHSENMLCVVHAVYVFAHKHVHRYLRALAASRMATWAWNRLLFIYNDRLAAAANAASAALSGHWFCVSVDQRGTMCTAKTWNLINYNQLDRWMFADSIRICSLNDSIHYAECYTDCDRFIIREIRENRKMEYRLEWKHIGS